MVVYVDEVFALNALLDFLLLRAGARLGGARAHSGRLACAAALGGLYAAVCCVPGARILRSIPAQLIVLAALATAAFGFRRRTFWLGALLLGLSFALCGVLTALSIVLGARLTLLGGMACYALDLPSLVLAAGGAYALTALCFSGLGTHSGGDIVPAQASLLGRSVRFDALRDTGNTLRDPISGAPVLVADWLLVRELLPPEAASLVTARTVADPAALLALLSQACPALRMRLIPYRAVGVTCALLLAVRCDALTLGAGKQTGALIALSPTAVSDGGGYRALTGGT